MTYNDVKANETRLLPEVGMQSNRATLTRQSDAILAPRSPRPVPLDLLTYCANIRTKYRPRVTWHFTWNMLALKQYNMQNLYFCGTLWDAVSELVHKTRQINMYSTSRSRCRARKIYLKKTNTFQPSYMIFQYFPWFSYVVPKSSMARPGMPCWSPRQWSRSPVDFPHQCHPGWNLDSWTAGQLG